MHMCCIRQFAMQCRYSHAVTPNTSQVREIISAMIRDPAWKGKAYDLISHNCVSFCTELSNKLGMDGIPKWTHQLADEIKPLEDAERAIVRGINRAKDGTLHAIEWLCPSTHKVKTSESAESSK